MWPSRLRIILVVGLGACILAGCLVMLLLSARNSVFAPAREPGPRVDIYADRFVYRRNEYPSLRALEIAFIAVPGQEPKTIEVRECAARDQLAPVLDLIRQRGWLDNVAIVMPDEC